MTTLDTLQTGLASFQTVVAIEGLQYLITDGSTSDALAAWVQTEWTQALGGLQVNWDLRQNLKPWEAFTDAGTMSFGVQQSEADTLGQLLFATTAGEETLLSASLDARQTVVTVKSTADFASSGSIHIGQEHITYTAKTATTFTGCVRGKYAPFRAEKPIRRSTYTSASFFGRAHPLPAIGDGYVAPPRVTSQQRTWIGRTVGIWIHARSGSALDFKSSAQCVFAGRIVGFRDEANGMCWFEVEHINAQIRNTVLLRDQWTAKVAQGISLRTGDRFHAYDYLIQSGTKNEASDLVVVASGASGSNEINAGIYTLNELAIELNDWLNANSGTLGLSWHFTPVLTVGGQTRSAFIWSGGSSTDLAYAFFQGPPDVLEFMGWIGGTNEETGQVTQVNGVAGRIDISTMKPSPASPMRSMIRTAGDQIIELEDVRGTWFNNKQFLHPGWGFQQSSTDSYGLVQMGDDATALMLCSEEEAGVSIRVHTPGSDQILNGQLSTPDPLASLRKIYWDSGIEDIPLRQVAEINGSFADVLTKILASTGVDGYNQNDHDKLPAQLGCAIPWELLGTEWVYSAQHIAEAGVPLQVTITKPTKFSEVFVGDLAARMSFFVWKNQRIRLATWSVPASVTSQHVLNESNKAEPIDVSDPNHRTVAVENDDYLVNAIKLQFARGLSETYSGTVNIIDKSSQYDLGMHRPITIELRNLNGDTAASTARRFADSLGGMMGILAHPLRMIRRTISPEYYENMAPGDVCLVSDDFVRDPSTGARGLTNRAAMVISHHVDYGGYEIDTGKVRPPMGQVDLILWPREKVVAHSPTVQVNNAAANGGYDAGNVRVTVEPRAHSTPSQVSDAVAFDEDDAVTVIEIDPDDPASPQSWNTTVSARDADNHTITLSSALTGFNSAKRYRIIPRNYASAVTSQQAKAFQATTDHMVVDTITAYEYGVNPTPIEEEYRSTGNEQAALYATAAYGDGAPLDVGYEKDAAVLVNNLLRFRTAPLMPQLTDTEKVANSVDLPSGTLIRGILSIEPVVFPPAITSLAPLQIAVRAWARTSSARSHLRVTLARRQPWGTAFYCNDEDSPVYGWERPAQTEEVALASTSWGATQLMLFEHSIVDPFDGTAFFIVEGGPDAEYMGLCLCELFPGDLRVPPLSWAPTFPQHVRPRRRNPAIPGWVAYVRVP